MKRDVAIKKAGLLATAVGTALVTAVAQSLLCLAYVGILTFSSRGATKGAGWTELPTFPPQNRALTAFVLLGSIAVPYLLLIPIRRVWTDARRFSPLAMGLLGSAGALAGFVVSGWASALAVAPLLTNKYAAPLGLVIPIVATVGGLVGGFVASLAGALVTRPSRTAGGDEAPRAADTGTSSGPSRSDGCGSEEGPPPRDGPLTRRRPDAHPAWARFLHSLAVGGLVTFGLLGFLIDLPNALQTQLLTIAVMGAAMAGTYVELSGFAFLAGCLLVVFTATAFPFVGLRQNRAAPSGWRRRAAQAAAFLVSLGLFTSAFRFAGMSLLGRPWESPLGAFALAYALAGGVAGILWRSPRIVLPSLLLSVALGTSLGPPLVSVDLPGPPGPGAARLSALLHLGGLTWLIGILAGATSWLLLRWAAPSRASAAESEPAERERPTGPPPPRRVVWAWLWKIAAGATALAALGIVALALALALVLRAWWRPSPAPWTGAKVFAEPSLARLFQPDRPVRSALFFETKDKEAMFVAELRDPPPRGYEGHYRELLRSQGVFIRASGGSAHAPRPVDSYQFILLQQGADSDRGWSIRYRQFWDQKPDLPEGSFWWPIEWLRPHPNPVQRRGNAFWVRLGSFRDSVWLETWPLPERDELEGPELPLPRFPGAVVRDWGPETRDDDILNPSRLQDVWRVYVVRDATPEKVVAHYERALREFGINPEPDSGRRHGLRWWGKEPFKGVEYVAVSAGPPGVLFGRPLDRRGEPEAVEGLFPRLKELVQVQVNVRFQQAEDTVALWPDVLRRRREFLLAARDGKPAEAAAPAPIAPQMAMLRSGMFAAAHQYFGETLHETVRLVEPLRVSAGLLGEHRVLVIPTGGLSVLYDRAGFGARLGQFVDAGGVVVAFSQAQGGDYDALPVPRGERLVAIGYDADRSVYRHGVRVDQDHPILAALSLEVTSINVDGAFQRVPDSARVLLRKTHDGLAALVIYPVGRGFVVASSIYDDCLSCQLPPGRPDVMRDLLAWARDPTDLPRHAPGGEMVLTVPVSNRGVSAASSVVLRLLSPSRDRVLAEATVKHATAPRRDGVVRWALRVPQDAPRGIHHVSYTLLDVDGREVQPAVESPVARLVVGEPARSQEAVSDRTGGGS